MVCPWTAEAFLSVCLACAGHGWQVSSSGEQTSLAGRGRPERCKEGVVDPSRALASLLFDFNPRALFKPACQGVTFARDPTIAGRSATETHMSEVALLYLGNLPGLAVPSPLCAEDGRAEDAPPEDLFTLDTITVRMPKIMDSVVETLPEDLAANDELLDGIRKLQAEMRDGAPLKLLEGTSERVGAAAWNQDLAGAISVGKNWHTAPWWLVENYMYKRLLEELDKVGGSASDYDPFLPAKSKSIAAAASMVEGSIQPLLDMFASAETMPEAHADRRAAIEAGLLRSLWGNQADLSLSAGSVGDVAKSGGQIITDHTNSAVDLLLGAAGKPVIIVLDNHGPEVLSDLVLVDALIRVAGVSSVALHVKDAPVFVSDVTGNDVAGIVDWVDTHAPDFGKRLRGWLEDGRLRVVPNSFYTTARFFWQLPDVLNSEYQEAAVVVLKGDANYRRLLADLHWPYNTSFGDYTGSFWPSEGLISLRTMKSGVALGIPEDKQAEARAAHPEDWLTCGIYGQILASHKSSSA